MADTPLPTTDPTASKVDQTVGQIVTAAETATEAAIITAQPWMGTVVVKQLWEAALGWVFGLLSGFLGKLTGYMVVDIQEYFALKTAASALVALQAAQRSGDSNALNQANANMDNAVAPVLHYIGTS